MASKLHTRMMCAPYSSLSFGSVAPMCPSIPVQHVNLARGCALQEDNVTVAVLEGDPFINCYRAWLKEKQFSSGTGAEFLSSFTQTSGKPMYHLRPVLHILQECLSI